GHIFEQEADFVGFVFPGKACFGRDESSGEPTRFINRVSFSEATFAGDADFGGAIFAKWVWLQRTTFKWFAVFNDATFNGHAWFSPTTFEGNARFLRAKFLSDAIFAGAS